mmetsp:Transcript_75784/g.169935  ORF Transcript_75784/g.169935 Transcript_75784/m.169935 type:complete len:118 (+) Transcript_75784:94-447(+)
MVGCQLPTGDFTNKVIQVGTVIIIVLHIVVSIIIVHALSFLDMSVFVPLWCRPPSPRTRLMKTWRAKLGVESSQSFLHANARIKPSGEAGARQQAREQYRADERGGEEAVDDRLKSG